MIVRRVLVLAGWLILIAVQIVSAQEKMEAPVWNVGDKWIYTPGMAMEIVKADGNGYVVRFQSETIVLEKSTLNRVYTLRGREQERYQKAQRRLFNFPLTIGKKWKDTYSGPLKWEEAFSSRGANEDDIQFFESYRVLGWEEVEVEAGRFKALKIEYKKEWSSPITGWKDGKAWYWYSPEAKALVKAEYEKNQIWGKLNDWELVSFRLMK
jgi:hypothetical protein